MPGRDHPPCHDPSEQLARLRRVCRQRSVSVYRDQALYLQILRDELLSATRQALYRLISDVDPLRFRELSETARQGFHAAVDSLVQRCSVLLTVEQLRLLVDQMRQENRRRQARASRGMLEQLAKQREAGEEAADTAPRQEASGSIELSLASPLDSDQPFRPITGPQEQERSETADADSGADPADLDVLRSLFQLAGEALDHPSPDPTVSTYPVHPREDRDSGLLPSQPDALGLWMEGFDQAMDRRLRNLSHAVNVQLLRSGLASTLLPVTLLEAVLRGQMETQPAASNLLRLHLPIAVGEMEQGMDVLCLLLRTSELEFDSHRLRRVRRRLREHQQEVHTMVRQQRHWERRCLDREALSHWQSPSEPKLPPENGD